MFMFRAKKYLSELAKFRPDILEACQAAVNTADNGAATSSAFRMTIYFCECPDESVDYAVMEKTADAVVVRSRCRLERRRLLVRPVGRSTPKGRG